MQVPDAGADVRRQQFGIVEGERGREGGRGGSWYLASICCFLQCSRGLESYSKLSSWLEWARETQANSMSLLYCFSFLYFPFFIVLNL